MELTRRGTLALGAGGLAMVAMPGWALAAGNDLEAKIAEFTGGAEASEGGVEIDAPEIAENGNTVPIEVSAEGAQSIMVLAEGNPNPGVAVFQFGPLAAASQASTRIRLMETQDVVAVAKMQDGSFRRASRNVKVTIGGCGG